MKKKAISFTKHANEERNRYLLTHGRSKGDINWLE